MRMVHEIARYPGLFDVERQKEVPGPCHRDPIRTACSRHGFASSAYGNPAVRVLNYWDRTAEPDLPRVEVDAPEIKLDRSLETRDS